jgi:hypothetical protein
MDIFGKSFGYSGKGGRHWFKDARHHTKKATALCTGYSMIRKSGNRFSEKIMFEQRDEIMIRFNPVGS